MAKLWTPSFISMATANILMAVAFYFIIPTLPLFASQVLQVGKGDVGIIIACFTLSAMIIRPFSGVIIDRAHRKKLYFVFYFLFAITFALYACIQSFHAFLLLRILHGLFWGLLSTTAATLIVDILPVSKRGEGLGIYGLGMPLGMALGPWLSTLILKYSNFQNLFLTASGLALLGWICTFFIVAPPHEHKGTAKLLSLDTLFEKRVLPVFYPQLLLSFVYSGVMTFTPLFDHEEGFEAMGLFFLTLAFASMLPRFIAGKVFDRQGPRNLCFVGLGFQILAITTLACAINTPLFLLSAFFFGVGNGTLWPTFQAMVNFLVPPEKRGAGNSTYFNGFDLGMGIGALSFGQIADHIGIRYTFALCLIFTLAATLLVWRWTLKCYERSVPN